MIEIGNTSNNQFIPFKMSKVKQVLPFFEGIDKSLLTVNDESKTSLEIIYFFMRYLAGGDNIKGKAINLNLTEFINHMAGKKSKDKTILSVCKQAKKMVKAKDIFTGQVTSRQLEKVNKLVISESHRKGYRKKVYWVGDINIKPYAYKVCHESMVGSLLQDFLVLLNDDSIDLLDRLIIGTHQFYAIHPFKDGNGRTWRNLFWSLFSTKYDEVQTLFIIFYFKLIDYEGLYMAQSDLRKGIVKPYINYWKTCIEWSHKALTTYQSIFINTECNLINKIHALDYWLKNEKINVKIRTF